jgi:hypothetical protein
MGEINGKTGSRQPINMHRLNPLILHLANEISRWGRASHKTRYLTGDFTRFRVVDDTNLRC